MIPLTLTDRSALLLEVHAGGHALTFQLDTGASQTVLARETHELLGLPPGDATDAAGAGGAFHGAELVTLPELRVGDAVVRDLVVGVMSFAAIGGLGADGVLGQDVLRQYIAEIDVPGGRLALHARGSTSWSTPELVAIPYRDALGLVRLDGALDGTPVGTILDVGAAATVVSSRVTSATRATDRGARGADGQTHATGVSRCTLVLGDFAFAAADLHVADLPVFDVLDAAAILGMDLLAARRIVIDPDARCVYLG